MTPAILAQTTSAQSRDDEIEQMKAQMQEMAKTIKTLQSEVASLKKEKAVAGKQDAVPPKPVHSEQTARRSPIGLPSTQPITVPPSEQSQIKDRDTFLDEQWAAPRVNNAPIDPTLIGFLPIPGTNTIIRFGGSARLDVIADDSNNGNPNEFIPSSFPVPGQHGAGGPSRSQVEAKGARITFELRRPVGEDNNLRVYYENDFFGDASSSDMTYRLRHLYGQAWNLLVGQTYSNFMDIDAFPDVLDYEGPNGLVDKRQPQIRYTQPFLDAHLLLAFGVEQPESQINTSNPAYGSGASTVNRAPDLTAHVRYEDKRLGHFQLSGIYRYLSFRNDASHQGVLGWGASLSGALNLFAHDTLTFQGTYGEGIARYIPDPSGLSEDAALDDNGVLRPLPAWGVSVGYTHHWTDRWRSTVSYGHANVDTENSNGAFAYDHSNYVSGNLIYQWSSTFGLGLEYLYGTNEVRNGASHDGQRLNFVLKYDLVK